MSGLKSSDTYTVGALRTMLTESSNGTPNYRRTIIDLAKSAGFETIWISNQGFKGEHDTPISRIASKADDLFFTNSSSYEKVNLPDSVIMPIFRDKIKEDSRGSRLIVLHTMGSHPDACERAKFSDQRYSVSEDLQYIECYVSSIALTDKLIEKVVNVLSEEERTWSLIYFSDHGLSHDLRKKGIPRLINAYPGRYHLDVPLIRINSDDVVAKRMCSQKNGDNFFYGLADWLGVTGDGIYKYDLFDGLTDSNEVLNYRKIDTSKDDSAIVFSSSL